MERTLRWRHLAPTAPNTLGTSHVLVWVFFPWWICHWNNPFSTQRLHHTRLSRFSYSISLNKIIKKLYKTSQCIFYIIQLTGCYPFTDRDPFLIESCPHVYFIGNQEKFDTRLMKGIFSHKPFISVIIIAHFLLLNNKWTRLYIFMYMLFENAGAEGQMVRLIAIPRFCETGIAVMVICFYFNSPFNIVAATAISFYFNSALPIIYTVT